jgi:Trk-type K+ transport system membrane component
MNLGLLCKLLGLIAMLIGGSMAFSLPWALPIFGGNWEHERAGFWGLVGSMAICFAVGALLRQLGRKSAGQLFRKEAMAVVGLSWVLATVLGALPFTLSGTCKAPGVRMDPVDSMFEAQSGFSTTGATVLTELEDPAVVPRSVLFWRSSTHFLGGLGIIVLFVAILGQGSAGKALMRAEMPGPSQSTPQARMQHTAWVLFLIYAALNALLATILLLEGLSVFDALCHAFGTMATGGFSTYNASVGHFATVPGLNGPLIEMTITLFMLLAGTNFMLMYWVVLLQPKRLVADMEWRTYVTVILVATAAVVALGIVNQDFDGDNGMHKQGAEAILMSEGSEVRVARDGQVEIKLPPSAQPPKEPSPAEHVSVLIPKESEVSVLRGGRLRINLPDEETEEAKEAAEREWHLGDALRYGLFQVVAIMTTTGFCTDNFDLWSSFSRGLLLVLMFVGGCAGSTGGGLKVIRHVLFVKILRLEIEQAFHPSVVRPLRIAGQPVEDPDLRRNILVYFGLVIAIFVGSWLFTITVEPADTWTNHGHEVEHKLIDAASCVTATLNNIGPGLGVIGATKNYSNFTRPSKLLFIWLMMLGRLELFVILVLFVPSFWRSQ